MEHKEYRRIVDRAEAAILFVHGIVGTPNHFDVFLPLVPEEMTVYNILLDGHGKGVKEFAKSSMHKWECQVKKCVDELAATHEKIYIVAHSMGTLFAIEQAIASSKIAGLFLLAVPIKLFLRLKMFATSFKVFFNKVSPNDLETLAAKKCCGVALNKNIFAYIGWAPRFLELFKKIKVVRKSLAFLDVPCYIYQSHKDEMVSNKSVAILKQNTKAKVKVLENSGHYYYEKNDLSLLLKDFEVFVTGGKS